MKLKKKHVIAVGILAAGFTSLVYTASISDLPRKGVLSGFSFDSIREPPPKCDAEKLACEAPK